MSKTPNLSPEIEAQLDAICENEKKMRAWWNEHYDAKLVAEKYQNIERDAKEVIRIFRKYKLAESKIELVLNDLFPDCDVLSAQEGGRPKHHTNDIIKKMGLILFEIPTRIGAARIIRHKLISHKLLKENDTRDENGIEQVLLKTFPNQWKRST
jgi:hypothetical protein